MRIPHGHPWRVTLMWTHKSLLTGAAPPEYKIEALMEPLTRVGTWSALADESAGPQVSESGDRVWGRYAIEGGPSDPWWETVFTDEAVLVRSAQGDGYAIPYEDMRRIELPDKKSPASKTQSEIWYDESAIEGFSGQQYPVRGATWTSQADGLILWRNIYSWHSIVLATYHDRSREGLEQDRGWWD